MASADPDTEPHVVILAGGIGSRFWPASRPDRPKQLLPLGEGGRPLLRDAVSRALALTSRARIQVLAQEELLDTFRPLLPELPESAFVPEPARRGTAPVLAWAAHRIAESGGPDSVMVSLHADHHITPAARFSEVIRTAIQVAGQEHRLVTLGVQPDRPETGYGWIEPGEGPADAAFRPVRRFREKPDAATARDFLARGLLWNSGIFVWRVGDLLEAFRTLSPEVGPHLGLLTGDSPDSFFSAVTPVAVDVAVLERSREVVVVDADFQWDDVGTWESLHRSAPADDTGNVVLPSPHSASIVEATGNMVWPEDGPVHLLGVRDLIVVRSGGQVVVARREDAHRWKDFLAALGDPQSPTPPPTGDTEPSA